jgi:hypothetical protein
MADGDLPRSATTEPAAADIGPPDLDRELTPAVSATRYMCALAHLRAPMLPAFRLTRAIEDAAAREFDTELLKRLRAQPVGRGYARRVLKLDEPAALGPGVDAELVRHHCRIARRQVLVRDIAGILLALSTGLFVIGFVSVLVSRHKERSARITTALLLLLLAVTITVMHAINPLVLLTPICGAIGCLAVFMADNLRARYRIRKITADAKSARAISSPRETLSQGTAHNVGNVLAYQNNRIIGAGSLQRVSTITVAVDKPQENNSVPDFSAEDLFEYIAGHARQQGRPSEPTHGIPRLQVAPVLVVPAGQHELYERQLPIDHVYARANSSPSGMITRAFVCVRAVTWGGQLVVSVFVSVALEGRYLRVAVFPYLLRPLHGDVRMADGIGSRHHFVHLGHSAIDAARELADLAAQFYIQADKFLHLRSTRQRKEHRSVKWVSIREEYAQDEPDDLIQREDELRLISVIQARVFSTVEEFLREHGVDTGEFRSQALFVLQNSVLVQGDVGGNIQNVQGTGASAVSEPGSQSGGKS